VYLTVANGIATSMMAATAVWNAGKRQRLFFVIAGLSFCT
jgi:hypothetical protein